MRTILIALTMLISFGAEAQQAAKKPAGKKHARHKKPEPEQNFKVCRFNAGYYICDQVITPYNSTNPGFVINENEKPRIIVHNTRHLKWPGKSPQPATVGPENQSYPENIYTVYGVGNEYKEPHYITVGPFDYTR